jgi:hypothetical protein
VRVVNSRPLQGCSIGISVSESETSSARGFPSAQVNRVTFDIASALLGQGARVVFGHDWRPDGVMEAVCRFALLMAPEILPTDGPVMENLLPWPPERQYLDEEERKRLSTILRIEQLYLPEELSEYRRADLGKGPLKDYLRARGLTLLRRALDKHTRARICFGGRTLTYQGRYPGIFEEAYFAVQAQKPLYLAGSFGGATMLLIDAIMGKEMPDNLGKKSLEQRELYAKYAALEQREDASGDRVVDLKEVWSTFQKLGLHGLSELNRLDEDENRALFDSLVLEQTIHLILAGVGRLCGDRRGRNRREE